MNSYHRVNEVGRNSPHLVRTSSAPLWPCVYIIRKTAEHCAFVFAPDLCSPEYRDGLAVIGANAKDALMKHAASKSPTRYYEILTCILSVNDDLATYIKIVFLEPSVRNVPMNHLVSVIDWIDQISYSTFTYFFLCIS